MISNMDFLAEIIFFNNNRQAEGWHKKEVDLVHGFFLLFPRFSSFGKVMSDHC